MDVLKSDTGADFSDAAAIKMSAAKSSLQQKSNTCIPVAPTEAMVPRKLAANRTAKVQANESGKKQSNRPRFSSTESVVSVSMASGTAVPGSTQSPKILVVKTESSLFILFRRDTPQRQSAQAPRLLLSASRSRRKKKEKFSEGKVLKRDEK